MSSEKCFTINLTTKVFFRFLGFFRFIENYKCTFITESRIFFLIERKTKFDNIQL